MNESNIPTRISSTKLLFFSFLFFPFLFMQHTYFFPPCPSPCIHEVTLKNPQYQHPPARLTRSLHLLIFPHHSSYPEISTEIGLLKREGHEDLNYKPIQSASSTLKEKRIVLSISIYISLTESVALYSGLENESYIPQDGA